MKILEQLVPNIADEDNGGIRKVSSARNGRSCFLPAINNNIRGLRIGSLSFNGVRLFNILPKGLRNTNNCQVDVFKKELDKFLKQIPDEPQIPGYTAGR